MWPAGAHRPGAASSFRTIKFPSDDDREISCVRAQPNRINDFPLNQAENWTLTAADFQASSTTGLETTYVPT